jgi:class 3 adenylate cyclase
MSVVEVPETRYATSGDAHIAYQVVGEGPVDILYAPQVGAGNIEDRWGAESGSLLRRLGRFARVIAFDKRGTGLSGRVAEIPTFEEQMDDVAAVIDAAGSSAPVLVGNFDGAVLCALFAATYPERTRALVTLNLVPRVLRSPDYPWGVDGAIYEKWIAAAYEGFGLDNMYQLLAPSRQGDEAERRGFARSARLLSGPGGLSALLRMWAGIDIRPVLPTIRVPTLVVHRRDSLLVPADVGRYAASEIPGAVYFELLGTDVFLGPSDVDVLADEIEEFVTGSRPLLAPDRVLATVLFTDIVGSTERATELGDERWRKLLDAHDAVARSQLDRFRGREIKTTGDGFLATFDGPARAIRCALEIAAALPPLGIVIRAGLHTGEVEVRGDDIAGIAVHTAQRVQSIAEPGEVLVSRTVADLVAGSGIEFHDRGDHELKGIPGSWRLLAAKG